MKTITTIVAALPLLLLLGCSNPAREVPGASVAAPTNSTAAATTTPEPGGLPFAFGPTSATIDFIGSKVTGRHNGGFRNFAGEFKVTDGHLADTGNKIVIDMSSTWADNERVGGHLKSPDFFNVGQFPTATFESISIAPKSTNFLVTGNLTLHGVTKEISFPAQIKVEDGGVTVGAGFFINRFDFGIQYPGKANDLVRKEVVLRLAVKATPGKADFAAIQPTAAAARAPRAAPPRPPSR